MKASVIFLFLPRITEIATATSACANLPTNTVSCAEVVLEEILVELLDVRVEAPAFAVDHHFDEVALEGRNVIAGHVRINDLTHERRVRVGVEQIERFIAKQLLVAVLVVDVKVHRPFQVGRYGTIRGVAAKLQANVLVEFAVYGQVSGHGDVGSVKGLHLLLPLVILELDEQRAERALVVKLGTEILDIAWL